MVEFDSVKITSAIGRAGKTTGEFGQNGESLPYIRDQLGHHSIVLANHFFQETIPG